MYISIYLSMCLSIDLSFDSSIYLSIYLCPRSASADRNVSGVGAEDVQALGVYLTESVYNIILQKSSPAQIRRLILYHY